MPLPTPLFAADSIMPPGLFCSLHLGWMKDWRDQACSRATSPISLRAVFSVWSLLARHGCPLSSSLAIGCAGQRAIFAASLRLCLCVGCVVCGLCVWLTLLLSLVVVVPAYLPLPVFLSRWSETFRACLVNDGQCVPDRFAFFHGVIAIGRSLFEDLFPHSAMDCLWGCSDLWRRPFSC